MKNKIEKAFTLIELLVVIAIIGILAGILFVAINPKAQADKANDAKRIVFMNQLEKALELYAMDHNGQYPSFTNVNTQNNGSHKDDFRLALKDYLSIDLNESFLGPQINNNPKDPIFLYSSPSSNNYRTYGMMTKLLHKDNEHYSKNDEGNVDYWYEKGQDPAYCEEKYPGSNWWLSPQSDRCNNGN